MTGQRPQLMRSELTGRVYIITRYKVLDPKTGRIEAITKYDVTDQYRALVDQETDETEDDL
jgi:hypothetical protein